MTRKYHIRTQAEDLKIGDLFLHWAVMEDDIYPEASRIIDIKKSGKKRINVILADGRNHSLKPEMVVVIQSVA